MAAGGQSDIRRAAGFWRQHTFFTLTALAREPRRLLAFFSIQVMSELTPPSAFEEALLLSHPVSSSSTRPPFGPVEGRALLIETSPPAACLMMALRAAPVRMPDGFAPVREARDIRSRGPVGAALPFVMPPRAPLPLTTTSIFRSPSRSVLPPRACLLAAGPRGALRGVWRLATIAGMPVGSRPGCCCM